MTSDLKQAGIKIPDKQEGSLYLPELLEHAFMVKCWAPTTLEEATARKGKRFKQVHLELETFPSS